MQPLLSTVHLTPPINCSSPRLLLPACLVCAYGEVETLRAGLLSQELVDQPEELLHDGILAQVVVAALHLQAVQ
jgi:hypothetical protein